jgi:hypothetical protein
MKLLATHNGYLQGVEFLEVIVSFGGQRDKLCEHKNFGFNRDDETIEEMEIAYTSPVGYVFPLPRN